MRIRGRESPNHRVPGNHCPTETSGCATVRRLNGGRARVMIAATVAKGRRRRLYRAIHGAALRARRPTQISRGKRRLPLVPKKLSEPGMTFHVAPA
jgi:hypothetical protein